MPLRLKLKPHERIIIGGAIVQNGRGRGELLIDHEVPVLREADILRPASVRTPCERLYMVLQLVYIDTEQASQHLVTYRTLVGDVLQAAPSCQPLIDPIDRHVAEGRFYQALKQARRLIDHERELMSDVH